MGILDSKEFNQYYWKTLNKQKTINDESWNVMMDYFTAHKLTLGDHD